MLQPQRSPAPGPQGVYDVIIVLGAAVWPHGQPSPALRRRVAHAVHLLHAGCSRTLLVTGGLGTHPPTEAYVMRRLAMAAGVAAADIVMEDQATSTFESALYCTHLAQRHGWSTALVVTDRYHLPRTIVTFRSFGLRVKGHAPPNTHDTRRWQKKWYSRGREILALCWYVLRIGCYKIRQLQRHHVRGPG